MDYCIVLDESHSYGKRLIRIYLKRDSQFKEIEQIVHSNFNAEEYLKNNIDTLWQEAALMPKHFWDSAIGQGASSVDGIYREMLLAAAQTLNDKEATLSDIVAAMELEIETSDRAGDYAELKRKANDAKASERDEFFTAVLFIAIGQIRS